MLVEDQTIQLESKNKRLYQVEESSRSRDGEIENLEGQLRRSQ